MSVYEAPGFEYGEFAEGEFGEFAETGLEFGEGEGEFGVSSPELSEFAEFGETSEAQEQFLGNVLGSLVGGEVASPLSEGEELELASELLEISSEGELEQFLGGLFKRVATGVGRFIKSPVGRALGGVLKGVAKKALPVVGGALGSMVAPGIGTAIGSKLGSLASGLFEVELEGLPQEQAELEIARRYVNLAAAAARNAALARPRIGVDPRTLARAAVARAARMYAPGVYRQMMRTVGAGVSARPRAGGFYRRPSVYPRPRPIPRPSYLVPGAVAGAPIGVPEDALEPAAPPIAGAPLSGRWVRRGRKIIVLGV